MSLQTTINLRCRRVDRAGHEDACSLHLTSRTRHNDDTDRSRLILETRLLYSANIAPYDDDNYQILIIKNIMVRVAYMLLKLSKTKNKVFNIYQVYLVVFW